MDSSMKPRPDTSSSTSDPPLPFRAQVAWLIAACLFIGLGLYLTPELLCRLGPMRTSFTSNIPSVRKSAYLEIKVIKAFCIAGGIAMITIAITWKKIVTSQWVAVIRAHQPLETERHRKNERWLNPPLWIMSGFIAVCLFYVVVGPHIFSDYQLYVINAEDGVIEWATALLFLLCSGASFFLATRFREQRNRFIMHTLLGILFFMMFGEEISWGQRLFHLHTLSFFERYNVQHENNLHNLVGYFADHLFMLGLFLYGFLLPMLCRKFDLLRKAFNLLGVPVASPGLALGFLMSVLTENWIIYHFISPIPYIDMPELRELFASLAFTLLLYESWLLVPPPSQDHPPPHA